jgi:hypothetical protein
MRRETAWRRSQFVDPEINHCTDDNEKPVEYHEACSTFPLQLELPAAEQGKPNHGSSGDGEGSGSREGVSLGHEFLADFLLRANLHVH